MAHNNRITKLKNEMGRKSIDSVLISSVPNITYLTGFSNFSSIEREAYLLITQDKQYIITDGRYSEAVHRDIPHFELVLRSAEYSLDKLFSTLKKKHSIAKLGIEENNLTISEFKMISKYFKNTIQFSAESLRIIKDEEEIESIKKACALGDKTFDYIIGKLKSDVSEKEIAFEIELFIKQKGADISFEPIVAIGANSSVPHHETGEMKLKPNSIVLLDFGVKFNNYCSDMTRTVFFGKANVEFKKMYQAVFEAQSKALDFLNTKGTKASEVDKLARQHIIDSGYPTIPHSLGHGIGLEVHEPPRLAPTSNDKLKPGMVFSVEPGIYLPGFGGVRIEDLVVLQNSNARILTSASRSLIEI